ncbi:MAG TPA: hypothetical protein VE596_19115 [Gaiellaceae bacterium]|nr:hypothetical protein [Gaiellaceae bacterium]
MVTQQASALDKLRSRASTILAAAVLVTTFLGAHAFATPFPAKADAGALATHDGDTLVSVGSPSVGVQASLSAQLVRYVRRSEQGRSRP